MAKIKTRDAVKGTIKAIDKAAVALERMKAAYAKTKEKAEQGYYAEESSATEYAADKVSYASERIAGEGVHQFISTAALSPSLQAASTAPSGLRTGGNGRTTASRQKQDKSSSLTGRVTGKPTM